MPGDAHTGHGGADVLGHPQRRIGRAALQHHGKFIPAQPHRQVTPPHTGLDRGGHSPQHRVARGMAVVVIDRLEAVQVQHQQCSRPGLWQRAEHLRQPQIECLAVGQAGQRVVVGGPFQRLPCGHLVGDVGQGPDRAGVGVAGLDRQAPQTARKQAAVAAQKLHFTVKRLAGGKCPAHQRAQGQVILVGRIDDLRQLAQQCGFTAVQQAAKLAADQLETACAGKADAHRRCRHDRLQASHHLGIGRLKLRPLGADLAQHLGERADLAGGGRPAGLQRQAAVEQVLGALLQLRQRPQLPAQQYQQAQAHRSRQARSGEHGVGLAGGQRGQYAGTRPPAPDQPVCAGHAGHGRQRVGVVQRQPGCRCHSGLLPPQQRGGPQAGFGVDSVADPRGRRVRQDAARTVGDHHQLVGGRAAVRLGEGAGQVALPKPQGARQQHHRPAGHHHRVRQHNHRLGIDAADDQARHRTAPGCHGGLEIRPVGQVGAGRAVALGIPQQLQPALGARDEHAVKGAARHQIGLQKAAQGVNLAELLNRQLRRRIRQHALGLLDPYPQQSGTAQRLVALVDLAGQHGVALHPRQQQRRAQDDAQRQRQHTAQRQPELDRAGQTHQTGRPVHAGHAAAQAGLGAAIGLTQGVVGRAKVVMAA